MKTLIGDDTSVGQVKSAFFFDHDDNREPSKTFHELTIPAHDEPPFPTPEVEGEPKHTANICGWQYEAYVTSDTILIRCNWSEVPNILIRWNGHQAGDAGHGGVLTFAILPDGGDHSGTIYARGVKGSYKFLEALMLNSSGDWECGGFVGSLIFLGQVLAVEGWSQR